ncbi:RNA polymerase sigma factor [Streptomyces sp. NRRL F-5123]|uniref:RNA polymerase sigma factor n=1 Tax=Streptomyces sp. NRRL F-5123 TaxID=1463856 RepID=UPI00099CF3CF|nr:sigma-70 family RNA polymerase sigma factor [Streptomyces sp. NRRL F-5123]
MPPVRRRTPLRPPDPPREPRDGPWVAAAPLVRAAQAGDALALGDLLDLLTPYVTRLCTPIAQRDAPDAVQEALIAVFRGIGGLDDPLALYGWVRTVAVREAVRVAGRAARETPVEHVEGLPAAAGPELAGDVRDVLRRMTPEHRAVLVLRELEGLDEKAAGEVLNVSRGTVKSRLHRARNSFRKAWTR